MATAYIDADVIIRFLAADDLKKQERSAELFDRIQRGQLTVKTPSTTIADCVYVLSSKKLYNLPRQTVSALLLPLVRLTHFKTDNRRAMLRALELFATTTLDFGDALIVTSMLQEKSTTLYSYDEDFDRVRMVKREEP